MTKAKETRASFRNEKLASGHLGMQAIYSTSYPGDASIRMRAHLTENLSRWADDRSLRRLLIPQVSSESATLGLVAFDNLEATNRTELKYDRSYEGEQVTNAIKSHNVSKSDFPEFLLSELIAGFLEQSPNSIALFDHRLSIDNSECLKWCTTPKFSLENEVYHYVTCQNVTRELVENGLFEGGDRWLVAACFASVANLDQFAQGDMDLDNLLPKACHIITLALDGSGYVTWTHDGCDMLSI